MANVQHQITANYTAVDNISRTTQNIDKNVTHLTKSFTKLSGAFQNAFQFYVRFRIFGLINQGIGAIEGAIPGLIARGQEWARTVDDVADSTGLAAGQASIFSGVAMVMTGNTEGLTRALGALAQQTANHGDVLKRYGIQTKAANGLLLDTWTILGNVRRALSDVGNSFITTAAARDLLSRGGQQMLDWLTMSDAAFRMLVRDVRASGAVMTEAGLATADAWERTRRRLDLQITGVGNTLTQTLGPVLMRLVDGITNVIRDNLSQIVSFVATVVGFVTGVVSSLLGIDMTVESFAEKQDKAGTSSDKLRTKLDRMAQSRQEQVKTEDRYTDSLKRQIDAIDRQLAALSRQERAENARAEQKRLLTEIAEAKKELNDLRGKAVFAAGMSNKEAELARQAQAADIIEAQKKVTDAQKRLREHERQQAMDQRRFELEQRRTMLQEQLADHMKALADRNAADREAMGQMLGQQKAGFGKMAKNIRQAMAAGRKAFDEAFGKGVAFTPELNSMLFGERDDKGNVVAEGLVQHLERAATQMGNLVNVLSDLYDFLIKTKVSTPVGDFSVMELVLGGFLVKWAAGLGASVLGTLGLGSLATALGAAALPITVAAVAVAGVGIAAVDFANKVGKAQEDLRTAWDGLDTESMLTKLEEAISSKLGLGDLGPVERAVGKTFGLGDIEKLIVNAARTIATDPNASPGQLKTASQRLSTLIAMLQGEGSQGTAFDQIKELQKTIDHRLTQDGTRDKDIFVPLRNAASETKSALTKGGYLPQAIDASNRYLQRLAYPRPGFIWGQANVNLYMDKELLMTIAGVPIAQGNSSLRPQSGR